jgi:hypothetical protein
VRPGRQDPFPAPEPAVRADLRDGADAVDGQAGEGSEYRDHRFADTTCWMERPLILRRHRAVVIDKKVQDGGPVRSRSG